MDDPMDPDMIPVGPKPIRKLDQDVVNQIAASEVIHRPANAIKELLENSLDAGSTSIKVTLKDGGLRMIQIQDNGSGIRKEDLPLLCERFATSKIRKFEDLQSLHTYGFRGEALASISYVSHMSVLTKVKGEACGWKAFYQDGHLAPALQGGTSVDPKPSAANEGTLITAEDLFYNTPQRRKSFKSPADEYNRILDVVTKYAVHNPKVAFTCKKAGTNQAEVSTPSESTTKANISLLYGPALGKELLHIGPGVHKSLGIEKVEGWATNANWSQKRSTFLLFINHRLVDSGKMKKAIESLYTAYLPKGSSPFVYISLEIDPARVDVNVHPTKQEISFLDEDEVIETVVKEVALTLTNANTSRTFSVQTLLPGAINPSGKEKASKASGTSLPSSKPAPQHKVRMDPKDRTLESMNMFGKRNPSQLLSASVKRPRISIGAESDEIDLDNQDEDLDVQLLDDLEEQEPAPGGPSVDATVVIEESKVNLKSVKRLRLLSERGGDLGLNEIFRNHKFVGLIPDMTSALIQHETKLYCLYYSDFARVLFYQLGLKQFGSMHKLVLDPPPSVQELVEIAIETEAGIGAAGLDAEEVLKVTCERLVDRREMLEEYFSLEIDEEGNLRAVPLILPGYTPNLDHLPSFLLCMSLKVNWWDEQQCFHDIFEQLAQFYTPRPPLPVRTDETPPAGDAQNASADEEHATKDEVEYERHQLEHILFPAFRRYGNFPKELMNQSIRKLTDLPQLYRVFERC
ncbi:DNA mismatch repair protein Mlh1 [Naganishia albida]|nr:DNA mismatch repair protein Mlh1 [Naganishia albida]